MRMKSSNLTHIILLIGKVSDLLHNSEFNKRRRYTWLTNRNLNLNANKLEKYYGPWSSFNDRDLLQNSLIIYLPNNTREKLLEAVEVQCFSNK